jgi:hypothetical protein
MLSTEKLFVQGADTWSEFYIPEIWAANTSKPLNRNTIFIRIPLSQFDSSFAAFSNVAMPTI